MEILTCAATWMNLEDIISSDISQTQKDKYWVIHFCELFRVVRFIDWSGG